MSITPHDRSARVGRRHLTALALAFLTALVVAVAPASAAQRYASPTGVHSGNCEQANPCDIPQAVQFAAAGDEVIIAPGSYAPSAWGIENFAPDLDIHGVAGEPRPQVATTNFGGIVLKGGSRIRHVEVDTLNSGIGLLMVGGRADDMVVRHTRDGVACGVANATIADSVCEVSGPTDNTAVEVRGDYIQQSGAANDSTIRNVTAIAKGTNGSGIKVTSATGHATTLHAINTIARGPGADIATAQPDASVPASVVTSHSNYRTTSTSGVGISDDGTSQRTVDPIFTADTPATYHQAAGSPTIDAGANDAANGGADFDGDPRTINGTTDIGADERLIAPAATTGSVGDITTTTASVSATVNPNGSPTTYRFDYGLTPDYTSSTSAAPAGSSTSPGSVSTTIAGLAPGTTFHYRVAAVNAEGSATGVDRTFTTASESSPGPAPVVGPPVGPTPTLPTGPTEPSAKTCRVPKLTGKTLTAATAALKKAGCSLGKVKKPRARRGAKPVKLVVKKQSAAAGATLAAPGKVNLTLGPAAKKKGRR
jgi:hypothetical protein